MTSTQDFPLTDIAVLVGSPQPGSRTGAVAKVVAAGLGAGVGASSAVVELAGLGPALIAADDDGLAIARETIRSADLVVVATPVYKAGYTGILKLFLDDLDPTALEETVVVPVVVSASSAHGALADLQLRLVLESVGALLPVPSFVVEEHHLDHLPLYVDAWQRRFAPVLGAVVAAVRRHEAVLR